MCGMPSGLGDRRSWRVGPLATTTEMARRQRPTLIRYPVQIKVFVCDPIAGLLTLHHS